MKKFDRLTFFLFKLETDPSSAVSLDVQVKGSPDSIEVRLKLILNEIVNVLDLNTSEKKDEILNDLLKHGQQSLKKYEKYLIRSIYMSVMNGNNNELAKHLANYFEQQWTLEYNSSNRWFIEFLNDSKDNNRYSYERVLIRTAEYGKKFMKDCPILSISLQILFDGIDDQFLKEENVFGELWFTITIDGLKSITKYSKYISKGVMNEQINKTSSILFQALREYSRQNLLPLLEQCNIIGRQNLYGSTLDNVAEFGWKTGLAAMEERVAPINFERLLEKVDSYINQQRDALPKQSKLHSKRNK